MHEWDVSPKDAIQVQQQLREQIVLTPLKRPIQSVAGADVSLNLYGKDLYAGIIVLSYPDLRVVEEVTAKVRTEFPYIPGLLSFREVPGLLQCVEKLSARPDVLIVDGQGIAHPRRLGIATHLGVLTGIPTIGCAKSRLYGSYASPHKVEERQPITDPHTGEVIGIALKSKARSNPLIISPGHMVTVDDAVAVVEGTLRGYRLPEPTRRAHLLVNAFRQLNQ